MCIDSVNAFFGINMPLSRSTICFCRRQYSQSLFVSGFNAVYILPPRFYFFLWSLYFGARMRHQTDKAAVAFDVLYDKHI